jgi:hypothetical protein
MDTYTEVVFSMYDVTAKLDSTPTAKDTEGFCDLAQLSTATVPQMPKYATCEQNQFLLDGSMEHFPDEPQTGFWGYWSESISGADGHFAVPPALILVFTQPHSSVGLTLHGYRPTGEWPAEVHLRWRGANGETLATLTAALDAVDCFINKKVENYHSLILTFTATSKPYRRVKLTAIDYGAQLVFAGDEVVSAKVIEEVDLQCSELRVNTLDLTLFSKDAFFSILNPHGAFSVLQDKQQFAVYEYLDGEPVFIGAYYLADWSNTSDTLANFTAVSKLGLLDNVAHMGGIYNTTFALLAAELLAGHEYEIDPALANIPIRGYLPIGTRRTSLQHLCMAAGAVADCSRSEKIRLFPPPDRPSILIGHDRKFMGSKVTLRPLITAVEVTAYTYTAGNTEKELCREMMAPGGYRLTFDAPMHSCSITGGAVIGQGNNYMDFTVQTAGEVLLTGKEYIVSRSVIRRTAANTPANAEENILKAEQATLVSPSLAESVARRLLSYHSKRNELAFKMRLTGERLADAGIIENYGNEKVRGNIESLSIDLTGGWRADAIVVGKRIDTAWRYYCGDELYCAEGGII